MPMRAIGSVAVFALGFALTAGFVFLLGAMGFGFFTGMYRLFVRGLEDPTPRHIATSVWLAISALVGVGCGAVSAFNNARKLFSADRDEDRIDLILFAILALPFSVFGAMLIMVILPAGIVQNVATDPVISIGLLVAGGGFFVLIAYLAFIHANWWQRIGLGIAYVLFVVLMALLDLDL